MKTAVLGRSAVTASFFSSLRLKNFFISLIPLTAAVNFQIVFDTWSFHCILQLKTMPSTLIDHFESTLKPLMSDMIFTFLFYEIITSQVPPH